MVKLFSICLILLSLNLKADLLKQLKRNRPDLTEGYAKMVVESVKLHSEKYKVPPNVILGLYKIESDYQLCAVNKTSDDFGIGQVNMWHIKNSNLDKHRLLYDLDYSVDNSVRIFQWFYRNYTLEEAIMRYRCGTAKDCVNWKTSVEYLNKVLKYI